MAPRRGNPRAALDVSLGKKIWFNDFGAYAKADHDGTAKAKVKALAGCNTN